MCLISGCSKRPMLVRLLSASALRIALSVTLTTPQPTASLESARAPTGQSARTVISAEPAVANQGAAADQQDFASPGPGWG